jgi:hypothetical protein
VVVAFRFVDQPPGNRNYWLLVENRDAQVCCTDPGGEPAVYVEAQTRPFLDWHRGQLPWSRALRTRGITVSGDPLLAASLPTWNALAPRWATPPEAGYRHEASGGRHPSPATEGCVGRVD